MPHDFLIVGGGIGGAVLANLLGRQGKKVLVLERSLHPTVIVRPEIHWPATVKLLDSIIPASLADEWRLPVQGIVFAYPGKPLLSIDRESFDRAGVQPMSTDPNRSRELLLQQAQCELLRGMEVIAVLKERERIVGVRCRSVVDGGEKEFRADWTIGDDGAHSLVRESCGIQLDLKSFPIEALAFGFDWPASLPPSIIRAWLNPDRARAGVFVVGAIPWPRGLAAGLIPVRPALCDDPAKLNDAIQQFCALDPLIAEVVGGRTYPDQLTRIRIVWGHAPRYGAPGAILMGDAAHPVSPAGGQGANASVADALALADVVSRGDPATWLAEYERRRRPANERSQSITRRFHRLMRMPGSGLLARLLPFFLRRVGNHPALFGRGLRYFASAFQERPER